MTDAVLINIDNGLADVRLNRPQKCNAVDSEVMSGLNAALERIAVDTSIRVVVLSGEGKGFCAGLDMASFGDMVSGDLVADGLASAYDELSAAGMIAGVRALNRGEFQGGCETVNRKS